MAVFGPGHLANKSLWQYKERFWVDQKVRKTRWGEEDADSTDSDEDGDREAVPAQDESTNQVATKKGKKGRKGGRSAKGKGKGRVVKEAKGKERAVEEANGKERSVEEGKGKGRAVKEGKGKGRAVEE